MFKKTLEVGGVILCGWLLITLIVWATNIPVVRYSVSDMEYKNGVPEIQIWDIVEVRSSSGEKLPRTEWQKILASGRFDPVPVRE
jgi:hypothetical protein